MQVWVVAYDQHSELEQRTWLWSIHKKRKKEKKSLTMENFTNKKGEEEEET